MMRTLRAITLQSLQHALRTRVLLLVSVVALLLLFANLEGYGLIAGGGAESSIQREALIRTSGAEGLLSLWVECAALAGLFLGATAISSDLRTRTLETVLVRPVPRPLYFVGRWMGIQIPILAFSGAGIAISFLLLRLLRLQPRPLLWLAIVQLLVTGVLAITLAMAFGARWHPVTAASLAALLIVLPGLMMPSLDSPAWLLRWFARLVYFAAPAVPRPNQITEALSRSALDPGDHLPVLVLLENSLYTLAALALGCWLFQRREIHPPR